MLAAIGTPTIAASQATLPILKPQKCRLSLKKIKIKNKKCGNINF
jgi:hypothetical protein